MGTTGSEVRADVIGRVVAHASKRLTSEQLDVFVPFLENYYSRVDPTDLAARHVPDLYGAAMSHLGFGHCRQPGELRLRAYAPDVDRYGYVSPHSVVELVIEDMPFLVDSMTMELTRHGCGLHLVVHPVMTVRRNGDGELVEVLPDAHENGSATAIDDASGLSNESFMHIEIDRETDAGVLEELRGDLARVIGDVMAAVQDWQAMRAHADEIAAELDAEPGSAVSSDAVVSSEAGPAARKDAIADPREVAALLRWLSDGHFLFLGYRAYEFADESGEVVLRAVEGSGLGILRQDRARSSGHSLSNLTAEVRRRALQPTILNMTKTSSRSTVHRRSYLDYIGVKGHDADGKIVSERRFLGLFTTNVYKQWPDQIPILRRKVETVVERAGYPPDSHGGKALAEVLDSYPRDELFQISADELFEQATAIMSLQDRQRLRLLVRRDDFGRFVSCLVFLPRDRLTPALEARIRDVLMSAYHGLHLDYTARVGDGVLARLHIVIYSEGLPTAGVEIAELEALLTDAMRSWSDDLRAALVEGFGEERGLELQRRYSEAFPNSYTEDFSARAAASDLKRIEGLEEAGGFSVNVYRPIEQTGGGLRLKLYQLGQRPTLSNVLPLLQNMGLQVVDERPYEVSPLGGEVAWIYDFGLHSSEPGDLEADEVRERFHEAFLQMWQREVDNDGFNRLVLRAGLSIREVTVLRAYARYLRQAGTTFSTEYIAVSLANNPRLAAQLVQLFRTRFDPDLDAGPEERQLQAKRMAAEFESGLDGVVNLNEDRVLRRMLGAVQASLRTNYYQRTAGGASKAWLSIKLDPGLVPDVPLPRPMFETFVFSPRVEGVHLRTGKVARGGLRWSDRLEDYRTEVLGLMKAQAVKNAVIVPGGAKGGFVLKAPPTGDADALQAEAVACYRIFVRGLLDLADNLVGGEVVPPDRVVRYDTDDPYLVVAADKGTATFSDIANDISAEYGFWLGDAFASGGSSGYDHKAMGITARGAWVSVQRHFRDLGMDADNEELSAVGIGDMSGDVFGNGMLLSRHLKLVAAFDHRHIFLDPDPDPAQSFEERRRLFELPRSSWADYDPALLSAGGGVFPRSAKSVPLSPQAQSVLGVEAESLQPDELVRAILRAPVDLLWNGGIGTYVKSSLETNADAGDKANDNVRISAPELRCRVVGEGGNLGFTQPGRIEFAMAGGRVNTDAIDNSAGVDTSDHEVNIKILLGRVVADGGMTMRQRDELLAEMTDDVAVHVLEDNDGQTRALYNATTQALSMLDVHARALTALEKSGLNRELEHLPSDEELRARANAGRGLTMPELAVVLAYAKSAIFAELVASDLPEDAFCSAELEDYFPLALRERHLAQLSQHPLRREIIATRLTNHMVNHSDTTFVFRLAEETGCATPEITRAHMAAWRMFSMQELWSSIEGLDNVVPASVQVELFLEVRKLMERAARWLLVHRRHPIDVVATASDFAAGLAALADHLPGLVGPAGAASQAAAVAHYVAAGVPETLARQVAGLPSLFAGLDLNDVARTVGRDLEETASVYFALGEPLSLDVLLARILALPRDDRWQALAREAVREDLYTARAWITADVLRLGTPGTSGGEQVARWLANMGDVADRCLVALDGIVTSGQTDLAALSVGMREIRNLVQVSRPMGG
ncbi:MAG: NAD-glutamate dehydrogenase [Acidimicrobiales bacterium]|jgi:glutamate dehydrogenase